MKAIINNNKTNKRNDTMRSEVWEVVELREGSSIRGLALVVVLDGQAEILHKAGDGLRDHDHVLHGEDPTPVGAQRGLLGEGQGLDGGLQEGQAVAVALDLLALERLNHIIFLGIVHLSHCKSKTRGELSDSDSERTKMKGSLKPRRSLQSLRWRGGNKVRRGIR